MRGTARAVATSAVVTGTLLALALAAYAAAATHPASAAAAPKSPAATAHSAAGSGAPTAKAATTAVPTLATRVAGLERHDGFLPFYWDARKGRLLIELPASGEPFLYGASLASGAGTLDASLDRAQLGSLGLCRFHRVGPRVLLRQQQMGQRSGVDDAARSRVVEESFPTSVLASFAIEAESDGRLLLDATDFLLGDTQVLPILRGAELGDWHQDAARSVYHPDGSGAFPRNTELEVELTFASDRPAASIAALLPDGRTLTLRVHHSFVSLPAPGYKPRATDPRVGYFGEIYQDHTAPYHEPIERELADRWRLEKRDPAAALSAPRQPLVYYIDSGMPEPERSVVKRGVLWWNHAFEEAGFKNAVEVRDLPPGASLLDVRYSGIAWVNRADRAWSIGQVQTDPRTGEILHAVVILDSHRRRTTARMWENLTPARTRGSCEAADAPDASELVEGAAAGPRNHDVDELVGGGPSAPEDSLVFWRLTYLAAHEVGHTLGLGHNWAATTFVSDHWGSVMDYLAPNIRPLGDGFDLIDAYPHDIGAYDRLAIRWGYTPGVDAAGLDRIVGDALARGIVLPADADWRYAQYDVGPDPSAWLATTSTVRHAMLDRFGMEQLAPGSPVYDLQRRFNLAYLYHRFGIEAAQQAIGGQFLNNAVAGDGQVPASWAPDTLQRRCLARLTSCLAPAELDIPERVLATMIPPPSGQSRTREGFASEAGETFSPLSAARILSALVVRPLLDPERAARLTLRREGGALMLDEVESSLVSASWDAKPEHTPRLASLQRVTQRVVLDALLDLAASADATPEVRAITTARIEALGKRMRSARGGDAAGAAHVAAAARDIDEFLRDPAVRKARRVSPSAPPGRPIGE